MPMKPGDLGLIEQDGKNSNLNVELGIYDKRVPMNEEPYSSSLKQLETTALKKSSS